MPAAKFYLAFNTTGNIYKSGRSTYWGFSFLSYFYPIFIETQWPDYNYKDR